MEEHFYNNRMGRDRPALGHFALLILIFVVGCSVRSSDPTTTFLDIPVDDPNPPILEEEFEARARGEVPEFDLLAMRHVKVERWIEYFQGRGRKWFRVWLERSGRYIPLMRKILRDHGLPEDLVYLAMVESGFSSKAYSRARAVGQWQFMRATGRLDGLKVNFWVDERRDPEKATIAAARHLKDLFDRFQSWKLAAAAYNAGAGRVSRAIRRYKTEDFWAITRGSYLRRETRNYVPKIIAAATIAKKPRNFGFYNIRYLKPLEYEKIILEEATNLELLAKRSGYDVTEILKLNPELNHPVTPPDRKNYELRVPSRSSEKILLAYNSMSDKERFQFTHHRIRRGDTVSAIAKAYHVPWQEIVRINKIRSVRKIRVGQHLIIPVPKGVKLKRVRPTARRRYVRAPVRSIKKNLKSYRVRRGDTLWDIAETFDVSLVSLRNKNGLTDNSLRVGQRIQIPSKNRVVKQRPEKTPAHVLAGPQPNLTVHVVRRGESLWMIAKRYGTSVRALKVKNNLRRNRIHPGSRLLIPST